MGGNALNVPSCRLEAEEYSCIADNLESIFQGGVIKSYSGKESFGDLDFLYVKEDGYSDVCYTKEIFEKNGWTLTQEPVQNGTVTSYGVLLSRNRVFQIDFIGVPWESFNFSYCYYAFNDMGNLLGRIARKVGLKLSNLGLVYIQRAPENNSVVLKEHLLTSNWDKALKYLGYDTKRYRQGFDELEDIFEFIISSPYYDFDKFDLTKRNGKARVRDSKRPNYRAFLKWANEHHKKYEDVGENFLNKAFIAFPKFKKAYEETLQRHSTVLAYKAKYNGAVVYKVTGLVGKQLGKFMGDNEEMFSEEFVLDASQEEIERLIFYKWCSERF